jgi:tetratricopeptide (TPR) repeat protein
MKEIFQHITQWFEKHNKWMPLLLVVIAFAVYSPTIDSKFLGGRDDDVNVVENVDIREFSWENIQHIFTRSYLGMYAPVKMLVYMTEFSLWKINPLGYHLVNIFFHLINVYLVFFLIKRLLRNTLAAWLAALLFAIHPMSVESVVWISARGELMYACFYLLALINYVKYIQEKKKKYLYFSIVIYPLALLTKATAVTLPLVIVLIDWFYHRKLFSWKNVAEKAPYFLLALISGLVTIHFRNPMENANLMQGLLPQNRLEFFGVSFYSVAYYLVSFIFPYKQSVIHPFPFDDISFLPALYYISQILLFAVFFGVFIIKNKNIRRTLTFGLLFFLLAISINIQFVPIDASSVVCERYTYVPYIGLLFLFAWAVSRKNALEFISQKFRKALLIVLPILFIAYAGLLLARNLKMQKVWSNTYQLFTQAAESYPRSVFLLGFASGECLAQSEYGHAFEFINKALELSPINPSLLRVKGNIYYAEGKIEQAKKQYLLQTNTPEPDVEAEFMLYKCYRDEQKSDSAEIHYKNSIEIATKREDVDKQYYEEWKRAIDAMDKEDYADAQAAYTRVLDRNTKNYEALVNRGLARFHLDMLNPAMSDFELAKQIAPNRYEPYLFQADIYSMNGYYDKALENYNKVLDITKNPEYYIARGYNYLGMEQQEQACADFQQAKQSNVKGAEEMIQQYCK